MEGLSPSTTIEELAAMVSTTLESAGISAVLSGGAVVSIYTNNEYESGDLDFISPESTAKLEAWAKREGASEKLQKFKQGLVTKRRSK